MSLSPVLVPGAGLARLAFDIAFSHSHDADGTSMRHYPFAVEAVDNSLVMGAAAYNLINRAIEGDTLTIYPKVADPHINEVDSQKRWQPATFPENDVLDHYQFLEKQQSSHRPSLSYVVADFVTVYASPAKHAVFGSILTSFFIDTATNIYEYILTVRNLLRVGGVWMNLGPVQWHGNAQLKPSTEELKDIIELSGFQIVTWEISESLMAYRLNDDIVAGTRVEAYRPLKFVAILQPDESAVKSEAQEGNLQSSLFRMRQLTGRKVVMDNVIVQDD